MTRPVLAAIALAAAAALSTLTPAAAHAAPSAPAASCTIDVGLPGDYYYQGVKAGEIEQQFDICPGDQFYHRVEAHWQWSGAFQANPRYADVWVYVGTGSPFFNGGTPSYNSPYSVKDTKDVYAVSPYSYNLAIPDEWRAGAELATGAGPAGTGCVQWGSLHYYGDGSEQDMPTGGCGSRYWTTPL